MLDSIIKILYDIGIICAELSAIAIIFFCVYSIIRYMYEEFNYIIVKKKCDTGWYYRYHKGFHEDLKESEK